MKSRILVFTVVFLTILVFVASAVSEISWSNKQNSADTLRQTVGLPSTTVGNLNPSARNPGIEFLCTGLFDVPGGFCNYFALGVPFINYTVAGNFTINSTGGP
jgi:hypothetical protein